MSRLPKQSLQSERAFRRLVDSVRDYAIFMLSPDGEIASWNPGAERIIGYAADEVVGQHFRIIYPEQDKQRLKPENELILARQTDHFEEEGWRVKKDGTRFWASGIIVAVRDDQNELLGFGNIIRDLTKRREDELRYRQLVEGVKDYAIYSLDPSGVITSWNAGAERIKQYKEAEILGRNYATFYTPEDREKGIPQNNLRIATEKGQLEAEGWRVRKDGTRFWSSVVITAIRNEEGELVGFSKITRDISDRKALMDQVQQHAEELEHRIAERDSMFAELESFSYSISHDLRAPLRAVEGYAVVLEEDLGEATNAHVQEDLHQIKKAAKLMSDLIQDLLEYSRLSRDQLQIVPLAVDELIGDILERKSENRSQISASVEPGLMVLAHKAALEQAVLNLVENALKFHKPGMPPQVAVTVLARNGVVRIAVRDQGIGIPPQHHQRIFEPFQRLHTETAFPGTGIGLALVKRIAERLNGSVGLESQPGQGSTFWIEIPAAREGL